MKKGLKNIIKDVGFVVLTSTILYSSFLNSYYPTKENLTNSYSNVEFKSDKDLGELYSISEPLSLEAKLVKSILEEYPKNMTSYLPLRIALGNRKFKENSDSYWTFLFPKSYNGLSYSKFKEENNKLPFNIYLKKMDFFLGDEKFKYVAVHELSHKIHDFCKTSKWCTDDFDNKYLELGEVYINSEFEKKGYAKTNIYENIAVLVSEIYRNYDGVSISSTIKNKLKPIDGSSEDLIKKAEFLYKTVKPKLGSDALGFFPVDFKF